MRTYNIGEYSVLKIEDVAVNKLLEFNEKSDIDETGGIILGKFNQDCSEYLITDICEVKSSLRKTPVSFIRDREIAQGIINDMWKKSDGSINYLGEWHTHVMIRAKPSRTDKSTIIKIAKESIGIKKYVFLIIIGENKEIFICSVEFNGEFKVIYNGRV
ncbi:Mov34/MPN/PAD-1 family protein [Clostridium beijerinckii]|uniref:Mov34/MPN/PAD-1 family protein n=1 Tax=Clostridium beijerinckii TaxID=1520 RepID=UPI00068663C0|nr:Mov34/MPN/PAD-1 family protein [Clostridium beijerinckii]